MPTSLLAQVTAAIDPRYKNYKNPKLTAIGISTAVVGPAGGNVGIGPALPSNIVAEAMEAVVGRSRWNKRGVRPGMFLFFSRRLGCVGSLIISLGLSLLILFLLGWL